MSEVYSMHSFMFVQTTTNNRMFSNAIQFFVHESCQTTTMETDVGIYQSFFVHIRSDDNDIQQKQMHFKKTHFKL